MISATLKMLLTVQRNDAAVVLDWKFVLKFGFEKGVILTKFHFFLHKAFHGDFWKGIPLFLSTSIVLDR